MDELGVEVFDRLVEYFLRCLSQDRSFLVTFDLGEVRPEVVEQLIFVSLLYRTEGRQPSLIEDRRALPSNDQKLLLLPQGSMLFQASVDETVRECSSQCVRQEWSEPLQDPSHQCSLATVVWSNEERVRSGI